MLLRWALVRTDVLEVRIASIVRVTVGELGTTLAVTSNGSTLRTTVLTKATWRNILEDGILHLLVYSALISGILKRALIYDETDSMLPRPSESNGRSVTRWSCIL
jgi:hypothetical protein